MTSFVSCDVMPDIEDNIDIEINEEDSSAEKNRKITEYVFDKICTLGEAYES